MSYNPRIILNTFSAQKLFQHVNRHMSSWRAITVVYNICVHSYNDKLRSLKYNGGILVYGEYKGHCVICVCY